jgi:hypothetical protein
VVVVDLAVDPNKTHIQQLLALELLGKEIMVALEFQVMANVLVAVAELELLETHQILVVAVVTVE